MANTQRATPIELELLRTKLDSDFSTKIEGIGVANNPEAKQRNFYSKSIAAFVLMQEAGANIEEAIEASIDGGFDHGIDSVFVSNDDKVWLIQSKYINSGFGEPELGEVSKFRDGVMDLLRGKYERFNNTLRAKVQAIEATLNSGICKVEVILAYTGTAISEDRRYIFAEIERAFNDSTPNFVSCKAFGLETLHELHTECTEAIKIDTEIELKNFGHTQSPYRAYYGQIDAKKLAELWHQHNDALVEQNIRRFKGTTGVNQSLAETLTKEPEHFFYFNNGITFLCKTIIEAMPRDEQRQKGKFKVKELSIINGAQTVGVIGSHPLDYYNEHPTSVFATFLCMERAPENFGIRVTQARNKQNAVDLEDFASLDEKQVGIKDTLSLAGITYVIKQGKSAISSSNHQFDIRELVPFLACTIIADDWQEYVIAAKCDRKKLFRQIGLVSHREKMQGAYQKLFPDSRTAKEIWRIIQIGRKVSETVKARANGESASMNVSLQPKEILKQGLWVILHIFFIKHPLQKGNDLFLTTNEEQTISVALEKICESIVKVTQDKQWGKSAQSVFENHTDCKMIKNLVMADLSSNK